VDIAEHEFCDVCFEGLGAVQKKGRVEVCSFQIEQVIYVPMHGLVGHGERAVARTQTNVGKVLKEQAAERVRRFLTTARRMAQRASNERCGSFACHGRAYIGVATSLECNRRTTGKAPKAQTHRSGYVNAQEIGAAGTGRSQ